jgi:hypothetical protein
MQPSLFDDRDFAPSNPRESALALLRFADLGIDDVQVVEDEADEAHASTQARREPRRQLRLMHRVAGQELPFDLDEKSAGTQTWFALIGPTLSALRSGRILLFDEIDASLHPRLSARLLELFQDPETNPYGAQLIFTTHDTSLLNHLNRDEVWLTEKDDSGATALTALAEFGGDKVRRSLNLEKAYLQGRFGAVPELDQFTLPTRLGSGPERCMMARNRRKAGERPLKRRVATRQPRKTLLIFCEGQKTEPEYLDALKRQPSVRDVAAVDLRVETGHGGSVPKTLVSMAIDARRRAIDEEGEIDEFWCVFDVEWPRNHPDLKDAVEQARQGGIELEISNPCFEVWLILHFQDHGAWLDNDDACRLGPGSTGPATRDSTLRGTCRSPTVRRVALQNSMNAIGRTALHFLTTIRVLACTASSGPSSRLDPEEGHPVSRASLTGPGPATHPGLKPAPRRALRKVGRLAP